MPSGALFLGIDNALIGRQHSLTTHVQPASDWAEPHLGAVAQLGERLICIQEVVGSNPISSTNPAGGPAVSGV